jgi:hypothetical protein
VSRATKLAIATLAALCMIAGQAHARDLTPGQRHHLAKYQGLQPGLDWSVKENQLTIRAAFQHFGMSDGIAQCVANRESHFDNDAVNPSSHASGLFQHLRQYWPGRVAAYNRAAPPAFDVKTDVFNARASSLVTAWMVRHGGWAPWGGGC